MQSKNSFKGFLADIQASSVVLENKQQLQIFIQVPTGVANDVITQVVPRRKL